jgi:hypothetical protein
VAVRPLCARHEVGLAGEARHALQRRAEMVAPLRHNAEPFAKADDEVEPARRRFGGDAACSAQRRSNMCVRWRAAGPLAW